MGIYGEEKIEDAHEIKEETGPSCRLSENFYLTFSDMRAIVRFQQGSGMI